MQIATSLVPWALGGRVAASEPGKKEKAPRRQKPPDDLSRLLIEWMMRRREARGWNQSQLATESGVNRVSIVHMEKGRQEMRTEHLLALAKAFGLSLRMLLNELKTFHDTLDEAGQLPLPPLGGHEAYETATPKGSLVKKKPAAAKPASSPRPTTRPTET
jgi:transcriptional regulator with XRE-family HTH domain